MLGLMVAKSLTKNPDTKILVLEAGDSHLADPRISILALWS